MSLLAWVLLAASLTGDDDPEAPPSESSPRLPVSAANPRAVALSVREAVGLSLNHNLDIEVARYQPWIEDQNVFSALGAFDHVAYADVAASKSVSPGTSSLSGATRLRSESLDYTLGLRKTLPFGGTYDLSFSSGRFESNNSFLLLNPTWEQSAGLSVSLPLLRGFGTDANGATLLISRYARDISVDAFEKSLTDSVFAVTLAYWDLVFAIETKKVKDQSLEVARRLLEDNRRKFERGVLARIEVTQADAGLAVQQEGILTAELAVLNTMDRLKRLVDPSMLRDESQIVPMDGPRLPERALDERATVEASMDQAMARRPELLSARKQLLSQDVVLARAKDDLLPVATVSAGGFLNGVEGTFPEANREVRKSDFYDLSVGLSFEFPIENSAARGALSRAELERRRILLQARNLENQVLLEIREAVRAIKTDERRIEAARRARVLAKEQVDGTLTRLENGLSTTFRVLDTQEDLVQAQVNELKALIDYHLAWHRLDQVSGMLLERNRIVLQESLQPRLAASR